MLSTRDLLQNERYIQTKSKGIDKDSSCKQKQKAGYQYLYQTK